MMMNADQHQPTAPAHARRKDDGQTFTRSPLKWDQDQDLAAAAVKEITALREQLRFVESVACELAGFLARSDVVGARVYIATLRAQGAAGCLGQNRLSS